MRRHDVEILSLIGLTAASSFFLTGLFLGRAHGAGEHHHRVRGEAIVVEIQTEAQSEGPERLRQRVWVAPEHAFEWQPYQGQGRIPGPEGMGVKPTPGPRSWIQTHPHTGRSVLQFRTPHGSPLLRELRGQRHRPHLADSLNLQLLFRPRR